MVARRDNESVGCELLHEKAVLLTAPRPRMGEDDERKTITRAFAVFSFRRRRLCANACAGAHESKVAEEKGWHSELRS